MSKPDDTNTGVLSGGRIEYALAEAAMDIDSVIDALENMKENGLEYVVMSSGNYRGASWQSVGDSWSWADES